MKLNIIGASNFVTRFFEACGPYQWAREFLKNSEEAGATRVEFGIEWQAVEHDGVYRRTIVDNGKGMDREQLKEFFSTLGAGDKKIGGVHDNFGVGAKIAALPWNPYGLVVISYVAGRPAMIRIELNAYTNEYELVDFETPEGRTSCVIDPSGMDFGDGIDWNRIAPDWARDHGTTIVLIGGDKQHDTILGNPGAGETDIKGLSVYLNSRFWNLPRLEEVRVVEVRSDKKAQWPIGPNESDDARRVNNRTIHFAQYYIKDIVGDHGKLAASGELPLDDGRVRAEWYLWEGERPAIHSYARKPGYIAIRYRGELYEISSDRIDFRHFGVVEQQVRQNLFLILEPQLYDGKESLWGVHPDQSRNRLIFTGNGDKGVKLPMSEWGLEFSIEMPQEIKDAIRRARGEGEGSIRDEEYRKRLQDKFGNRWTVKKLVRARSEPETITAAEAPGTENLAQPLEMPAPTAFRRRRHRQHARLIRQVRPRAVEGSNGQAVEREVPVSIPHFRFRPKEEFAHEWLMASWIPTDPDGPTVIMNQDAPMLLEAIAYHQEQYPPVHAEDIQKIVMDVYGEVAVSKIAHSAKLASRGVSDEDLDEQFRTDEALTFALMGLMAEESLISQRLGRLGRKKSAA